MRTMWFPEPGLQPVYRFHEAHQIGRVESDTAVDGGLSSDSFRARSVPTTEESGQNRSLEPIAGERRGSVLAWIDQSWVSPMLNLDYACWLKGANILQPGDHYEAQHPRPLFGRSHVVPRD